MGIIIHITIPKKITSGKPKAMVCTPGFIWRKWGELEYKQQVTGEGESFRY